MKRAQALGEAIAAVARVFTGELRERPIATSIYGDLRLTRLEALEEAASIAALWSDKNGDFIRRQIDERIKAEVDLETAMRTADDLELES